jgi:hypothetical protein
LRFLKNGGTGVHGKEVIITSYEHLNDAVAGRAGTHILPPDEPEAVTENATCTTALRDAS